MNISKLWKPILAMNFLIVIGFPSLYQNCAKINFSEINNSEESSGSHQSEEPQHLDHTRGPTNGDGYEGKLIKYYAWSQPGECQSSDIVVKGEIQQADNVFEMTKSDCIEIPARQLDDSEIEFIGDGIVYQGTDYTQVFPTSCQEIYDGGGVNPSGNYWLDTDGMTETAAQLAYCDMSIVANGFSAWSSWSDCSASCGPGTQQRSRTCQIHSCTGENTETRACEVNCP